MSHRPVKRSYTEPALERWLERLNAPWEWRFPPAALETARAIYRRGDMREIHLSENSATVFFSWNGEGAHAVLDWEPDSKTTTGSAAAAAGATGAGAEHLVWRSSFDSPALNDTHAAAALYEIEELVAEMDTTPPADLLEEPPAPPPNAAAAGGGDASGTVAVPEPRRLRLQLSIAGDGALLCEPFWNDDLPAYGTRAPAPETLTVGERSELLTLAARARRAGFTSDTAGAGWRLNSPVTAARFARHELPAWRQRWEVAETPDLALLSRPERTVRLVAETFEEDGDESGDGGDGGETGSNVGTGTGATGGAGERSATGGAFRLRWRLRLGTEWLPDAVARRLFASSGEAVFVPGQGMARLDSGQRRLLAEWGANTGTTGDATGGGDASSAAQTRAYQLLSLFGDARVEVAADARLDAWRAALLREPAPLPNLPPFLRPYQARGASWLAHMLALGTHPLLADEMGLGKTVQVLALLAARPAGSAPSLVVCPASVVPVWAEEARRFFPELRVVALDDAGTAVPSAVAAREGELDLGDPAPGRALWLVSYAKLRRRRDLLARTEFALAVLDEAQFIKNPDADVTAAAAAIRARHRLALTGTPLENHPRDLWSIFRFLMPGLLGSRTTFEARLDADPDAVGAITRQTAPFTLRRTKDAVAPELPPKVVMTLPCPLGTEQRALYRRLAEEGVAALGGSAERATAGEFLALLTRLRQAACDPALLPGHEALPVTASGKLCALAERLDEVLESGGKVVIFSQFTRLLDRVEQLLAKRYPAAPVFRLDGATADRAAPVAGFQTGKGAAVFLGSMRAGGAGLTLNAAEYVFLLDPWWNPSVEQQAMDRVHRLGQTRTTLVYRMVAQDTVEARVEALKEAKGALFEQIVGGIPDMSDWRAHFPSLRALVG